MVPVTLGVRPANPGVPMAAVSSTELLRIRVALIERINAAAQKALWGREPEASGMPSRLFAAGCYLAAHGYDEIACDGGTPRGGSPSSRRGCHRCKANCNTRIWDGLMARLPNPGHLPEDAIGKRVRVWFPDGREGRCDDNPMSPPGWAADGRAGCRWSLTGRPHDIAEYEVIE